MVGYNIEARLVLGDFDCSTGEITDIMGVSPDHETTEGEIVRNVVKAKRSTWWLHSSLSPGESSVSAQWQALRKRIHRAEEKLKNLPANMDVLLLVVVEAYKYMPDVEIPVGTMNELAALGLKMRIAIYDFREDENGGSR